MLCQGIHKKLNRMAKVTFTMAEVKGFAYHGYGYHKIWLVLELSECIIRKHTLPTERKFSIKNENENIWQLAKCTVRIRILYLYDTQPSRIPLINVTRVTYIHVSPPKKAFLPEKLYITHHRGDVFFFCAYICPF